MMMKRAIPIVMAAGAFVLGANAAQGQVAAPKQDAAGPEIRVINNYVSPVRVYVEDARGRLRALGRVRHSDLRVLVVPEEIARRGSFRVKVFPEEPAWTLANAGEGIRTGDLSLDDGDALNFWVEPDLISSIVELTRS